MPRSGGIFSLIPGYFAVDGTTIEVSQHNPVFEDVAQALTDSLPRDGSAPMTGNLPMGGFKLTGLAAGTGPNDSLRFSQLGAFQSSVSALSLAADEMVYANGVNTAGKTGLTAFARTLLDDVDAATARTTLGLTIGTDVQAQGATLTTLAGLTLAAGDLLYATGPDALARLAVGAAGQTLVVNSGATAPEWASAGLTFSASSATTSGSAVDITGIPATAREIEVYLHGVSLTAVDPMLVQLLVGGSPVTTGYNTSASSSGANSTSTAGFVMRYTGASQTVSGIMRLVRTDTGVWAGTHGVESAGNTSSGGGDVTGVGTVNGIRLTRATTGNFDAGSFRIAWR